MAVFDTPRLGRRRHSKPPADSIAQPPANAALFAELPRGLAAAMVARDSTGQIRWSCAACPLFHPPPTVPFRERARFAKKFFPFAATSWPVSLRRDFCMHSPLPMNPRREYRLQKFQLLKFLKNISRAARYRPK